MKNRLLGFLLAASTCFGDSAFLNAPFVKKGVEEIFHPELVDVADAIPKIGGKWFNPISDTCWKCAFPIHLAGINLTSAEEEIAPATEATGVEPAAGFWEGIVQKLKKWGCRCPKKELGVPVSFWEPFCLIEITPTPYKLLSAKGAVLGGKGTYKNRGAVSEVGFSGRTSFYNVHVLPMPIFRLLAILPGTTCLRHVADLPPPYFSEWDPTWRDPDLAFVFSPEMVLFATPRAQTACIADCLSSTMRKPSNRLFWCAGCQGSYYPLVGHVAHHVGGVQASYLLVHRVLAKIHAIGLGKAFEQGSFCEKKRFWRLRKSFYKTQLVHPIPDNQGESRGGKTVYCHPLGESDARWGARKTYPCGGEDFTYLVWSKMNCCYDLKDAAKFIAKPIAPFVDAIEEAVEEMFKARGEP